MKSGMPDNNKVYIDLFRKGLMGKVLLFLIFIILLSCTKIKISTIPPDLDDPEFIEYEENTRKNFETAYDLYIYDMLAWTTSDSVMARINADPDLEKELGPEWFIYQDKNKSYHAVYGKYYQDRDIYKTVLHFIFDESHEVIYTDVSPDSLICLRYARAINSTSQIVDKFYRKKAIRLNRYVLTGLHSRIHVWYLLAQSTSVYEVYGGDFQYILDPTGREIVDSVWNENGFRIVQPDEEEQIILYNHPNKYPTVDNLFCGLNILRKYREKVNMVFIISNTYMSTVTVNNAGEYSLEHAKLTTKCRNGLKDYH